MIKSVNNYPISQLFDIALNIVYIIPRYQREYTWVKSHWENLFDDVLDNDPGYFLGSIICINQSHDALDIQKLEVVDGQQRLTTLSLLFAAMYDVLSQYKHKLDEDQNVELINLKRKLILRLGDKNIRVFLQTQNNNLADYQAVLTEIKILKGHKFLPYSGNRKIVKAYRYFKDRLIQMADKEIDPLMKFLEKISKASMVKIEVENHTDAYILFESLNDRGVPLTAIDLIKNKLLAKLEAIDPGKIDDYFRYWNNLLECLGDDYSIQERFFRQYYNAFRNDLKSIYQVPVATRSNLMQIYDKLINHSPKEFLEKIYLAGQQYGYILLREKDTSLKPLEKPLKDLERIQGAPSYLLVLYLLIRKNELHLDSGQLAEIIRLLVCFFVRRNLTDTPPTRDLNRLFMGIIEKIADAQSELIINIIRQQLIAVSASNEVFQNKLEGLIYEENYGVTRFILCALEEKEMTDEIKLDLWEIKGKLLLWTVEHIFPQGKNIPDGWVAAIADGDTEKAEKYQQTHVHKLGNLTLSGFNTTLSNKSFQEKRDRTDKKGSFVGYKNGLKLNKELAKAETWSIEQIETRTKKMVEQAMNLFQIN